ncbi:proton-coupled zinc antiporter SLC30A9, mitochondrial-like [Mytilus galloprovincialis]|uniref:proton-coupled zinc antiporter SLC30A9, mitochondrial-like n=1 Tax=Mytilus galloprovincialis TaxID=29158 RepID=UPI003F7C9A50
MMLKNTAVIVQTVFRQSGTRPIHIAAPVICKECLRNSISFYGKWSQPKYLKFLGIIRYYSSSQVPPDENIEKQSSVSGGIPEKGLGGIPEQTATPSLPTSSPNDAEDPKLQKEQKIVKIRMKKPIDHKYVENIYIEPGRAMVEYLIVLRELNEIPKYTRRSPYGSGKSLTVYKRKDIEELAIKKYGSLEKLQEEKLLRMRQLQMRYRKFPFSEAYYKDYIDRHYFYYDKKPEQPAEDQKEANYKWTWTGTGQVVVSSICVNFFNVIIKGFAWAFTGSYSMFSEMIHSAADTLNQIILGIGLYQSFKKPDSDHPYGYSNLRHVSSLISGVGIFCIGTGFSVYHGIQGLLHPQEMGLNIWALGTLVGSLVSEGATLYLAASQTRKSAQKQGIQFWKYVWRGYDPNTTVVLLEDLAAVSGVVIASGCIGLTWYTGNPLYDSVGSIVIGGLLAAVAGVIIKTNSAALLIRSIPLEKKDEISKDLEQDRMIRSLHDVKATEMGGQWKFKAEVDFDGREIARAYLYKLDMEQLLKEMQDLQTSTDAEEFMLKHGQQLIDSLGEEIDRIEKLLKSKYPEIRHVDLEAL